MEPKTNNIRLQIYFDTYYIKIIQLKTKSPKKKQKASYQLGKNACDSPPRLKAAKVVDYLIMLKKGYYSNNDTRLNRSNNIIMLSNECNIGTIMQAKTIQR